MNSNAIFKIIFLQLLSFLFTAVISATQLSDSDLFTSSAEKFVNLLDSAKYTEATLSTQKEYVREEAKGSTGTRLTFLPLSPQLIPLLPEEGIQIMNLPYSVGRLPEGDEPESAMHIDLQIPDDRPFRLSRRHFALYENPDGYGVLDLGSALGTSLNEDFLGHNFGKDFGYLKMGDNTVTAGGLDSPFTFKILMESV